MTSYPIVCLNELTTSPVLPYFIWLIEAPRMRFSTSSLYISFLFHLNMYASLVITTNWTCMCLSEERERVALYLCSACDHLPDAFPTWPLTRHAACSIKCLMWFNSRCRTSTCLHALANGLKVKLRHSRWKQRRVELSELHQMKREQLPRQTLPAIRIGYRWREAIP